VRNVKVFMVVLYQSCVDNLLLVMFIFMSIYSVWNGTMVNTILNKQRQKYVQNESNGQLLYKKYTRNCSTVQYTREMSVKKTIL